MTEESSVFKQEGRFFKWYLWVVIFIVVGVFVSGMVPVVAGLGKFVGETPEEAVKKYVEKEYPAYASGYTPLLIEQYDGFTVILYELSGDSPGLVVRYQLVRHNLAGWYIHEWAGRGSYGIHPSGELKSYIAWGMTWNSAADGTLVFGKTISDDVAYVEMVLQDGEQTKRVDVRDGWFLILLEMSFQEYRGWDGAIRVLDADGVVLGERDW